jgi:hypothetical protein
MDPETPGQTETHGRSNLPPASLPSWLKVAEVPLAKLDSALDLTPKNWSSHNVRV